MGTKYFFKLFLLRQTVLLSPTFQMIIKLRSIEMAIIHSDIRRIYTCRIK